MFGHYGGIIRDRVGSLLGGGRRTEGSFLELDWIGLGYLDLLGICERAVICTRQAFDHRRFYTKGVALCLLVWGKWNEFLLFIICCIHVRLNYDMGSGSVRRLHVDARRREHWSKRRKGRHAPVHSVSQLYHSFQKTVSLKKKPTYQKPPVCHNSQVAFLRFTAHSNFPASQ